ncbi:CRISPR-associated endonuclease Cas2 [Campylobacter sp. VBCF_05 NA6]|uniref:CRISPR-associated endonuclease Cas2 n=1 Tax=unclassified Campylobacter TaxID=2593542 RepID=UPI0022E9C83C|nr:MULTISPECIES: CRISPR-associated endonuclease Cas2 [unclassified Campylobacter]MDA3057097.1 CRISPR-associated endonuclease Cas2 [Campylobacter sp. VBCF_04 NA7]MDA3059471.1 CRISPR-associated endonuclease Cas2 [Campylobacter sp. VBCF_05 NA6]
MKTYLICYDISDEKRARKVRKIAYSYALGGQKSALVAPLSQCDLQSLWYFLSKVIAPEDKINIIEVGARALILGKELPLEYEKEGIIV